MPSKKQSRKNTNQVAKPKAETTNTDTNTNDDDWGCILVKSTPSSRGSTRSNKSAKHEPQPQPEPEVVPEIPDWEKVGMTEEDYKAMRERVTKQMQEFQRENYLAALAAEWDSPSYWLSRIETLERCRERYNKKRAWGAEDISGADAIDDEIAVCEENLARIEEEWGEEVAAY